MIFFEWCSKKYNGDKGKEEIYDKFSDSIGLSRLQKLFKFKSAYCLTHHLFFYTCFLM